jgi:hypothetical protein
MSEGKALLQFREYTVLDHVGMPSGVLPRSKRFIETPHWRFTISNIHNSSQQLSGGGIRYYAGGLAFPEFCCECMGAATRHEIAVAVIHGNERAAADTDEWYYRHYWYAIPFCEEHSLACDSVEILPPPLLFRRGYYSTTREFRIASEEWGASFGELNDLEGHWINEQELRRRNRGAVASFILGIVLVGIGFVGPIGLGIWRFEQTGGDLLSSIVYGLPGVIPFFAGGWLLTRVEHERPDLHM